MAYRGRGRSKSGWAGAAGGMLALLALVASCSGEAPGAAETTSRARAIIEEIERRYASLEKSTPAERRAQEPAHGPFGPRQTRAFETTAGGRSDAP